MHLIDTHAHLNNPKLAPDIEDVLDRARQAKVKQIINVGADVQSSNQAVAQALKFSQVYATVGIHPHDAHGATEDDFRELERLATHEKVVAWGEIGLDYYYNHSPRETQQHVFSKQMEIAHKLALPVIIHNRDAHADIVAELQRWQGKVRGVLHCFSGSLETAQICLKLGYYISIAGPVTFKNARKLQRVVGGVPLDRLLIETDCPYLTPEPHRGKRNEPAYVRHVAIKVAEILGVSVQEVATQTTRNAHNLFKIASGDVQ